MYVRHSGSLRGIAACRAHSCTHAVPVWVHGGDAANSRPLLLMPDSLVPLPWSPAPSLGHPLPPSRPPPLACQVGYVQGLGFLAAVLLMYMVEEEVFWTLQALMQVGASRGAGSRARGMRPRGG
jgi:hypothetical protein